MAKSITGWLASSKACKGAVDLAQSCETDREFYDAHVEPSYIMWGAARRKPSLALRIVEDLVEDLPQVDGRLRPLLEAALASDDEGVLAQTLAATKVLVADLSRRRVRYGDRIVAALLEYKLGQAEADLAFGNIAEYVWRHNRNWGNAGAKATLMTLLRQKIPFGIWKQGL